MQEALHKLLALPKAVSKEVSVCCCRPRDSVLLEILSYIYKFIFRCFVQCIYEKWSQANGFSNLETASQHCESFNVKVVAFCEY